MGKRSYSPLQIFRLHLEVQIKKKTVSIIKIQTGYIIFKIMQYLCIICAYINTLYIYTYRFQLIEGMVKEFEYKNSTRLIFHSGLFSNESNFPIYIVLVINYAKHPKWMILPGIYIYIYIYIRN